MSKLLILYYVVGLSLQACSNTTVNFLKARTDLRNVTSLIETYNMDNITLELPSSGGALSETAINSAITDLYIE